MTVNDQIFKYLRNVLVQMKKKKKIQVPGRRYNVVSTVCVPILIVVVPYISALRYSGERRGV